MAKHAVHTYEPDANYRITVNRTVQIGGNIYVRPSSSNIVVTGAVAQSLGDAVETAEKIA